MLETVLIALVRKIISLALLFAAFKFIDNFYFKAFDTDEAIKENPIAIALIVVGVAIVLAFA